MKMSVLFVLWETYMVTVVWSVEPGANQLANVDQVERKLLMKGGVQFQATSYFLYYFQIVGDPTVILGAGGWMPLDQ